MVSRRTPSKSIFNRKRDKNFCADPATTLTVAGSTTTDEWDAANRLKSVNSGALGSYGYDGNGKRVKKSEGGATTYYVYSSVLGSAVMEVAAAGVQRAYVMGGTNIVAQLNPDGQMYWLHLDHLGSSRKLTDAAGNLVYRAEYEPYGLLLSEWSATTNLTTKKFTGYERDAATGLDYAQARMYASEWGRFLSPDPIGMAAVNKNLPQTLNRYSYANNNPINMVDRTGTFASDWDLWSWFWDPFYGFKDLPFYLLPIEVTVTISVSAIISGILAWRNATRRDSQSRNRRPTYDLDIKWFPGRFYDGRNPVNLPVGGESFSKPVYGCLGFAGLVFTIDDRPPGNSNYRIEEKVTTYFTSDPKIPNPQSKGYNLRPSGVTVDTQGLGVVEPSSMAQAIAVFERDIDEYLNGKEYRSDVGVEFQVFNSSGQMVAYSRIITELRYSSKKLPNGNYERKCSVERILD